jgi:hypothetical protein
MLSLILYSVFCCCEIHYDDEEDVVMIVLLEESKPRLPRCGKKEHACQHKHTG